jgi:hypothetical protein
VPWRQRWCQPAEQHAGGSADLPAHPPCRATLPAPRKLLNDEVTVIQPASDPFVDLPEAARPERRRSIRYACNEGALCHLGRALPRALRGRVTGPAAQGYPARSRTRPASPAAATTLAAPSSGGGWQAAPGGTSEALTARGLR